MLATAWGCAGAAWDRALREDSPAAIHRFVRDHPGSSHAEEAQMHLDFYQLERAPQLEGFLEFAANHPDSDLLAELRPLMETQAFELARSQGTAAAYLDFLNHFPNGEHKARATGNAAYLRAEGFGAEPDELRRFAAQHPMSDFATEANRSGASVTIQQRSAFSRAGLSIEVSPSTPEAERLAAVFAERALAIYEAAGIELIPIPEIVSDVSDLPKARLTISHREDAVATQVIGEQFTRPGVVARTTVILRGPRAGEIVSQREFSVRVGPQDAHRGASVLFGPRGPAYWRSFFVPVATWGTQASVRASLDFEKEVVSVDAVGSRAVVLFEDGDFKVLDFANPTQPVVLAKHEHARDLTKWSEVRLLGGDRVAIFGQDGLELFAFEKGRAVVSLDLDQTQIGAVLDMVALGPSLLVAGSRGLLRVDSETGEAVRVMRRAIRAVTTAGESLVFSDGESVFLSTLALLNEQRVLSQLSLGNSFVGALRMRGFDSTVAILGEQHALVLDITNPVEPAAVVRLALADAGRVLDVAEVAGRTFLLGDRGLQLLGASGQRIVEGVDLEARHRLAAGGRHLLAVGGSRLQVVDSTPFAFAPTSRVEKPAAAAPGAASR